jgi:hypothetical protein
MVLNERANGRDHAREAIEQAVVDHLASLTIIARMGGMDAALHYIHNRLPTCRRVRSGDLGEILASEYIDQCTDYSVPIKRLRWKDDRDVAMRGNDVIAGQDHAGRFRTLKAEVKSRATLGKSVVDDAIENLQKHKGRPNPSSLAFISARLRELGRDTEAAQYEALQKTSPSVHDIEHMVFTLSGNDPFPHLEPHAAHPPHGVPRRLIGCVVENHQTFIESLFTNLNAPAR